MTTLDDIFTYFALIIFNIGVAAAFGLACVPIVVLIDLICGPDQCS